MARIDSAFGEAIDVWIYLFFFFVSQPTGDAIDLVAGLDPPHHLNLRRRCGLRIDIRDGTSETSERAFGSRVLDAALLHHSGHQLVRHPH